MIRAERWRDAATGLQAVFVLDDDTLGPAAGGVRTREYPSGADAELDAARLARAMTIKCSLAGLDAGGGKVVVWGLGADRGAAFEALGRKVEELGGALLTAGDLGTGPEDLQAMARTTQHVHTGGAALQRAAGRALLRCLQACADVRGVEVEGLSVAIQGCGTIGSAAARAFSEAGVRLTVSDIDAGRALALAAEVGARVCDPDDVLGLSCDVVSPCAAGGAITTENAGSLRAWAVCGGANNVLASPEAERSLQDREVLFVPDVVASAGAVIEGVGERLMQLEDRTPLLDRLRFTARAIVDEAASSGRLATEVAQARALARLGAAALVLCLAHPPAPRGLTAGRADPHAAEVGLARGGATSRSLFGRTTD